MVSRGAYHNCNVAVLQSPAEQEAAIWAILEPYIEENNLELVIGRECGARWYVRFWGTRDSQHSGSSRLDALAQLAQAVALRE